MCKLLKGGRFTMQMRVDTLKPFEIYGKIYDLQSDISELVEHLRDNPNDYAPLIVDENYNIVVGVDIWRAFNQLVSEGKECAVRVSKQPFNSENEKILTMIRGCDNSNRTKEEYCRAVSLYCKIYSELFPQGSEGYKPIKKLYGDLPSIFKIQSCDPGKLKVLSACGYADYQYVGNKIFELEEQGRIDDLACLLIELEQFAPSYLRDNKILSQVDSWTDEDREQIRKCGRDSGISMRRLYDLNRKVGDKPKPKEPTQSLTSLIADLHDEEQDRSMNSLDVASMVYNNFATTYRNMRNMVDNEHKGGASYEAKQKCYELFDLFDDIKQYISNQFRL